MLSADKTLQHDCNATNMLTGATSTPSPTPPPPPALSVAEVARQKKETETQRRKLARRDQLVWETLEKEIGMGT